MEFVESGHEFENYQSFTEKPSVSQDEKSELFEAIRWGNVVAVVDILTKTTDSRALLAATVTRTDSVQSVAVEREDTHPYTVYNYELKRNYNEYTPLAYAARLNFHKLALTLVTHDSDVSSHNNLALRWAVKHNDTSLIAALTSHLSFIPAAKSKVHK